jgi:hypothetical protein
VIYVDALMNHGWILHGHATRSCHMFAGPEDPLEELHVFAERIGLKRRWFQEKSTPHYDLTPARRRAAVAAGAVELDRKAAVRVWRARRGAVQTSAQPPHLERPVLFIAWQAAHDIAHDAIRLPRPFGSWTDAVQQAAAIAGGAEAGLARVQAMRAAGEL